MRSDLDRVLLALLGLALGACAPSLNWRELQPRGSGLVASFPCKPEFSERPAAAGLGAMGLAQCEAMGLSFSLAWAQTADPTQVGPALTAMPLALASKLQLKLPLAEPLQVPGMTPHAETAQFRFQTAGQGLRIAVFSHGTRVYQAVLRGETDDAPAWQTFVTGLRVAPAVPSGGSR